MNKNKNKNKNKNENENIAFDLAKKLIAIDTSTIAGVKCANKEIIQWAKKYELPVMTFPKTHALLVQTNLKAKKTFAFVCHSDVVPADGWETAFNPCVKNGALYGRGAVDDKGPLSICLSTLVSWKNFHDINVSCLVVGDEEVINHDIQEVLASKKFHADYCLVADGGTHNLFDIGQKGIVRLSASVTTEGGHSAFEEAEKSASIQLLKFINSLDAYSKTLSHDSHFQPTFINVSHFETNAVPYGLPTLAVANLEVQFPSPQTLEDWLLKIKKLQTEIAHLKVTIAFTEVPHLISDPIVLGLITKLPEVSLITVGGVNLAKDLNKAGIPAVGHCPVKKYMGHCKNERMRLSDFRRGLATYNQLINLWKDIT